MNILKIIQGVSISLAILLLLTSGHAAENFSLTINGNQLCKILDGNDPGDMDSQECFPIVKGVPTSIDILAQSKNILNILTSGQKLSTPAELASLGGAMMMEKNALEYVVGGFSILKLLNIAVDTQNPIQTDDAYVNYKFFAHLQWAGHQGTSGVLHLEGMILTHKSFADAVKKESPDLNPKVLQYSDSLRSTLFGKSRLPETLIRSIHLSTISGIDPNSGSNVEELFKHVVSPVLFGEIFYVPYFNALAGIKGALESSFKKIFGGLSNLLKKF